MSKTYTAEITQANIESIDDERGPVCHDLVTITTTAGDLVAEVWVESTEDPELYDAAVRKVIGAHTFEWAE